MIFVLGRAGYNHRKLGFVRECGGDVHANGEIQVHLTLFFFATALLWLSRHMLTFWLELTRQLAFRDQIGTHGILTLCVRQLVVQPIGASELECQTNGLSQHPAKRSFCSKRCLLVKSVPQRRFGVATGERSLIFNDRRPKPAASCTFSFF